MLPPMGWQCMRSIIVITVAVTGRDITGAAITAFITGRTIGDITATTAAAIPTRTATVIAGIIVVIPFDTDLIETTGEVQC